MTKGKLVGCPHFVPGVFVCLEYAISPLKYPQSIVYRGQVISFCGHFNARIDNINVCLDQPFWFICE